MEADDLFEDSADHDHPIFCRSNKGKRLLDFRGSGSRKVKLIGKTVGRAE